MTAAAPRQRPLARSLLAFVASLTYACLSCRARPPLSRAPDAAVVPPPARPSGVVAVAHLGQPRASMEALASALDTHRPADFMLALSLGVDVAVMAAVDPARPLDIAVLVSPTPGYAFALTPPGAASSRSMLASRYRLAHVEGLGERLTPRGDPGLSASEGRLPCALVAVPARVSSRVVCASDEATLRAVGRWIAYESAAKADARGDLEAVVEGPGLARDVAPMLRNAALLLQRRLLAAASAARREHAAPPDYGDPEALIGLFGDVAAEAASAVAVVRRVTVRAAVSATDITWTATLTLPATGGASIVDDALGRAGARGAHPLVGLLPADALVVVGNRVPAASRQATLRAFTSTLLRVLGDRVAAPVATRQELDALVSRAGDELALSVARDAPDGVELTLALSQTDDGTAARASLARMAVAPWLRALRMGAPLSVTPIAAGGLALTRAPMPAVPPTTPTTPATRPVTLALGVRSGALVAVVGRNAAASLQATTARATAAVSALVRAEESVVAEADLTPLGLQLGGTTRLSYDAAREADALTTTLRVVTPTRALAALMALSAP